MAKAKRTKTAQLLDQALAQRERGDDQRAREHLQQALAVITETDEPLRCRTEEELTRIETHSRFIRETLALKAEAEGPEGALEILEAGPARNPDGKQHRTPHPDHNPTLGWPLLSRAWADAARARRARPCDRDLRGPIGTSLLQPNTMHAGTP